MKTDAEVIVHLNRLLKNELTAINQYFLHARTLKHWGFERLGKKVYEESIGEMRHADRLIQRILMIDGHPNLQDLGKLLIGETVVESLESDLRLETTARRDVLAAIAHCERVQDYVSREIAVSVCWPRPCAGPRSTAADHAASFIRPSPSRPAPSP